MRAARATGLGLLICLLSACGDSGTGPSGPRGTLQVRITDAPFDDARAVLVTFAEVAAHKADGPDGGWSSLPFADGGGTRTCDLKKLQHGSEDVLGVGALAAGHYTQLRLVVASARIFFDEPSSGPACAPSIATPSGATATVTVSSGEVKLNRQFTVPEGGATTMLLDFDGGGSIHQTGNGSFRMSPVVGIVSVD